MTVTRLTRERPTKAPRRWTYEAFGRVVASDLRLANLKPVATGEPQLRIARAAGPEAGEGEPVFINMTSTGETVYALSLCPDEYVWDYPRVGTFEIARDGSKIRWWARGETSQDIATMLCGPVLGFALQLQGVAGLHGTAVARSGEALGLLGPSGYGKSTLAAALLRRGYGLLTDDVLVAEITHDSILALPSRPQLKLWPGSLEHLLPDWQGLSVYVSWLDKRVYVPEPAATPEEAVDLRALYALAPVGESDEVSIERLRGSSALITLLGLGYQASQLARETALLKARMDHFQRLAERVPIYRLVYPRIFERLDEVANAVMVHTTEVAGRED